MKLTPRFTLAFILFASALLLGVGLFAYSSGRALLRSTTASELEGAALRKETNLNNWVNTKEELIVAMAADPTVIDAASRLLAARPASAEFRNAHDLFLDSVMPRMATSEFLDVSLLDPITGQVVASTSSKEEGTFKDKQSYFLNGKTGPYIEDPYYSDALQTLAMIASTPLRSDSGGLIGVLTARLDVKSLSTVIQRRTNVHETDESYLVNSSSHFVTPPRFISVPAALQQEVRTDDIVRCLQGESGVIETVDYRDVPAFMAYRWLSDRQLCLVVKIDQAEAYIPIQAFGVRITVISVIALLVAGALASALSRTMTRPILVLQNGVARFGKGDLGLRLDQSSGDELGELAGEFNKMADALVEQQTHLRQRAEEFFNLTLDLLCTVDASGRLQDLNPAWEQTLGHSVDELRGQMLVNLIHPDDLNGATTALRRVANQKTGHLECRCLHQDGNYRWLAWSFVFSTEDQLLYAAARDITERRSSEEKLQRQTDELERSNRDLEQFAYIASHDLQEPLRIVTNNVQLLANRYQGKLDKDADEFIGFALDASSRMKGLIGDLLAYSRVGARSKEFTPVILEKIFARVMEYLRPMIESTHAIVTHDPLPSVLADNVQMIQLFQNVVENAIKFHSVETPRIHVGVRQLGERWLFFVQDNGIGIDPQYAQRVFVLFQRLHNEQQYPGRGVGLAISRKIVERHGGSIWVDSEMGKGTTFYFTLMPAERWMPALVPPEVVKPRKDTVIDRATDLI
ncbi:MAG: ATP-binding protein [Anaerolineales bacterium]